jgi:hypothetical protein
MNQKERIKKDLELFEKNLLKVEGGKIVELSKRYYEDARYYLEKGDLFTAFGCINYAHGLLDAIIKRGRSRSQP